MAQRKLPPSRGRYEIKLELHGGATIVFINGTELAIVPPPIEVVTPEFFLASKSTSEQSAEESVWFSDTAIKELHLAFKAP